MRTILCFICAFPLQSFSAWNSVVLRTVTETSVLPKTMGKRFNKGKRHESGVLRYPTIYSLVLGYGECFCSSWGCSSVSNKPMAQSVCTQPLYFFICGFRRFTAHLTCRHCPDVPVCARTEVCGNRQMKRKSQFVGSCKVNCFNCFNMQEFRGY